MCAQVEILGKSCFEGSKLTMITFVPGAELQRMEDCCFQWCSLPSVWIPGSVAFLGKLCFTGGLQVKVFGYILGFVIKSSKIERLHFEPGSRLVRLESPVLATLH
jgi:hypothetical protein